VACEKENEAKFNTISGVVSAGENVTAKDLCDISIHLGKLQNGVNLSTVTTKTTDINWVDNNEIKNDGFFTFENLDNGNYFLIPSEGFMFAIDTFATITVDGKTLNKINRTIERGIPENPMGC
jgi:hypothetical protein